MHGGKQIQEERGRHFLMVDEAIQATRHRGLSQSPHKDVKLDQAGHTPLYTVKRFSSASSQIAKDEL